MSLLAIQRAYSKVELLAVPAIEVLEHFPLWSKTLAFHVSWNAWASAKSADLVELCQVHARGKRADELVLVYGKLRSLSTESLYLWRNLVTRSIGFRVAGVDHVIEWRRRGQVPPISDQVWTDWELELATEGAPD